MEYMDGLLYIGGNKDTATDKTAPMIGVVNGGTLQMQQAHYIPTMNNQDYYYPIQLIYLTRQASNRYLFAISDLRRSDGLTKADKSQDRLLIVGKDKSTGATWQSLGKCYEYTTWKIKVAGSSAAISFDAMSGLFNAGTELMIFGRRWSNVNDMDDQVASNFDGIQVYKIIDFDLVTCTAGSESTGSPNSLSLSY